MARSYSPIHLALTPNCLCGCGGTSAQHRGLYPSDLGQSLGQIEQRPPQWRPAAPLRSLQRSRLDSCTRPPRHSWMLLLLPGQRDETRFDVLIIFTISTTAQQTGHSITVIHYMGAINGMEPTSFATAFLKLFSAALNSTSSFSLSAIIFNLSATSAASNSSGKHQKINSIQLYAIFVAKLRLSKDFLENSQGKSRSIFPFIQYLDRKALFILCRWAADRKKTLSSVTYRYLFFQLTRWLLLWTVLFGQCSTHWLEVN